MSEESLMVYTGGSVKLSRSVSASSVMLSCVLLPVVSLMETCIHLHIPRHVQPFFSGLLVPPESQMNL